MPVSPVGDHKRVLRLFLASPQDVKKERAAVREAVEDYNRNGPHSADLKVEVIYWEKDASPNWLRPQQQVENSTGFTKSDIFVFIFWSRIGTPTGKRGPDGNEFIGGTVEELYEAKALLDAGHVGTIMLYFCLRNVPISLRVPWAQSAAVLEQLAKVRAFRSELDTSPTRRGLYWEFKSTNSFKYDFLNHLSATVNRLLEEEAAPDPPAPPDPPVSTRRTDVGQGGSDRARASVPTAPPARPPTVPPLRNPAAAAAGFVWQNCDRVDQVTDFQSALQDARTETHARPRAVLLYGDADAAHGRFVEWLVRHEIEAKRGAAREAAAVLNRLVAWPEGSGSAKKMRERLEFNLFREFMPYDYTGPRTAAAFLALPEVRDSDVVVVDHQIDLYDWDASSLDLLRWYLDEFWKGAFAPGRSPLVLLFLSLRCDPAMLQPHAPGSDAERAEKAAIERLEADLKTLCPEDPSDCRRVLLEKLGPVNRNHVRQWLERHTLWNTLRIDEQEALVTWLLGGPDPRMAGVLDRLKELFGRSHFIMPLAG